MPKIRAAIKNPKKQNESEADHMDDPNTMPERMREIEIFGVPALYTNTPIDPEAIYPGMSLYELQGRDGRFLASVLTPVPIPVLADGPRDLKPGELVMDTGAGYYTPAEFEEKYLSPDYGGVDSAERYGKEN